MEGRIEFADGLGPSFRTRLVTLFSPARDSGRKLERAGPHHVDAEKGFQAIARRRCGKDLVVALIGAHGLPGR